MRKDSNLKGAIFEWFVRGVLKSCGFKQVEPDGDIVYSGGPGLMIHGLGQAHNADVLMYPPFQIPLYFPSRLLVECKAYKDSIGLGILRGVLGLREDINNFEIVTPEILENRRNYRRAQPALHDYDRFSYQVAFAALKDVRKPAFEFAVTHQIPIISFYASVRYAFLRDFIKSINLSFCQKLGSDYKPTLSFFKGNNEYKFLIYDGRKDSPFHDFIEQSEEYFKHTYIGVLGSGDIIFLYSPEKKFIPDKLQYKSMIHWEDEYSEWRIKLLDIERDFFFELPPNIYDAWAEKGFDKNEALRLKEDEFKNVPVFGIEGKNMIFFILNLDMKSIHEARKKLES